jgi:hypothetical protein
MCPLFFTEEERHRPELRSRRLITPVLKLAKKVNLESKGPQSRREVLSVRVFWKAFFF